MKKHKPIEIVDKYPEFDLTEIRELALMEFEVNNKITKLAKKASKSKNLDIQKKEIFSESQFKSFNHFGDSEYTKIISFAVFYTLLKIDKPHWLDGLLSFEDIKDIRYGKIGASNMKDGITFNKWIKIATVTISGAWDARGFTLEVYPRIKYTTSGRQTLVCLIRNSGRLLHQTG